MYYLLTGEMDSSFVHMVDKDFVLPITVPEIVVAKQLHTLPILVGQNFNARKINNLLLVFFSQKYPIWNSYGCLDPFV